MQNYTLQQAIEFYQTSDTAFMMIDHHYNRSIIVNTEEPIGNLTELVENKLKSIYEPTVITSMVFLKNNKNSAVFIVSDGNNMFFDYFNV